MFATSFLGTFCKWMGFWVNWVNLNHWTSWSNSSNSYSTTEYLGKEEITPHKFLIISAMRQQAQQWFQLYPLFEKLKRRILGGAILGSMGSHGRRVKVTLQELKLLPIIQFIQWTFYASELTTPVEYSGVRFWDIFSWSGVPPLFRLLN